MVVKCKSMKLGLSLSYFFKYGWNSPVVVYSIFCLIDMLLLIFLSFSGHPVMQSGVTDYNVSPSSRSVRDRIRTPVTFMW
jgi:hypothetical protein